MTPTVRASALASYDRVARSLGLNPAAMLRRVNLDPQALKDPDIRLKAQNFGELLELSAAEAGCQTFGLRMAARRRPSDFGALSLLITHEPTLRDVLATAVRYSDLINETLTLTVEEMHGTVVVREDVLAERPGIARQVHELTVGVIVRTFRALLGERWRPVGVHFTHSTPSDITDHFRLFGDVVTFGSDFNGLVCDASDLDRANPGADAALAAYARRYVDGLAAVSTLSDGQAVRHAIAELLPTGQATLTQVGVRLGVGPRTLQRRLAEQGFEFRALLDGVRIALARRYVEDSELAFTQVAQLLGYSQLAAFSRWFLARFGEPPSRARARGKMIGATRR